MKVSSQIKISYNTFIRFRMQRMHFYAWKTINPLILCSQRVESYQSYECSNLQEKVQKNSQCCV